MQPSRKWLRKSPKAVAARQATKASREYLQVYRALLEDDLREEGLTLPQLRLLHAVEQQAEISAAAIARLCHITPQTMQSMLTRAVREGWITRGTSERNHRIMTASLTPRGEAVLQRGEAIAAKIEAQIWKGTSVEALTEFNFTLDRAIANLHALALGRNK